MQNSRKWQTAISTEKSESHSRTGSAPVSSPRMAALILALFFAAWELGVRLTEAPVYILPAPSRILATLARRFYSPGGEG